MPLGHPATWDIAMDGMDALRSGSRFLSIFLCLCYSFGWGRWVGLYINQLTKGALFIFSVEMHASEEGATIPLSFHNFWVALLMVPLAASRPGNEHTWKGPDWKHVCAHQRSESQPACVYLCWHLCFWCAGFAIVVTPFASGIPYGIPILRGSDRKRKLGSREAQKGNTKAV